MKLQEMKPKSRPPIEKKHEPIHIILPVILPTKPAGRRRRHSKVGTIEHAKGRRPSFIREHISTPVSPDDAPGELPSLNKKNISYKHLFLPRLTSKYVSE